MKTETEGSTKIPNGKDEKVRGENRRIKGDLKERTKQFALNIVALYSQLPKKREAQVLGDAIEVWHFRGRTLSGGATSQVQPRFH